MGRLTNRPPSTMISRSAEANRRSSPTRSRHRSGHGNHEPLRSFLFGGPWSRTSRDAVSSAICARGTRDKKEQNASENHDHVGRGPVRRNAPPSAPSRHRPTLLQHERLHQLSHRRPGQRRRSLRDLRLHPPAPLTAARLGPRRGRISGCPRHGHIRAPDQPRPELRPRRQISPQRLLRGARVAHARPAGSPGSGLTVPPRDIWPVPRRQGDRRVAPLGIAPRDRPAGASSADGDLPHPND